MWIAIGNRVRGRPKSESFLVGIPKQRRRTRETMILFPAGKVSGCTVLVCHAPYSTALRHGTPWIGWTQPNPPWMDWVYPHNQDHIHPPIHETRRPTEKEPMACSQNPPYTGQHRPVTINPMESNRTGKFLIGNYTNRDWTTCMLSIRVHIWFTLFAQT